MKVAIIGYGRMGATIAKILEKRNHEIVARFDSKGIDEEQLAKADVAIEFSRPEAAFENLVACFKHKVPVVCGTTGWLAKFDEASKLCNENEGALLYASNFSLGVNIFFEINKYVARIMDAYSQYDISMEEIHHTTKLDKPSGTAITLAEQIIEYVKRKEGWTLDKQHDSHQIEIDAIREENVPGTHSINYNSDIDSIEITHTAHGRMGFAFGAVVAAEFLHHKQGIYSMKDVLNF